MKNNLNGPNLYSRAKSIIPGGTMLLSKRPELYLPDLWPSYYSKASGYKVWDLENNEFSDMTVMGVGTNTLGYGHPKVDEEVIKAVKAGNMSTLNSPQEVFLAEKLIDLNPWAQMVRFARTGGEANSIAIRIARAASNKDGVAICGYHGWHDWYLSANLNDKNELSPHLLPDLAIAGVPKCLKNTVHGFNYNDFQELERIVKENEIGVIKMEVIRNFGPTDGFLEKVRKLATDNGIVLIFDECTSGFRETFGGIYTKYNVNPDIVLFGKTLGNGYAITAIVGKREVMESAQRTFISSTFWTERIGPAAALSTLKVMEELKSWEIITKIGVDMRQIWEEGADIYNLDIGVNGIPALSTYYFNHKDNLKFKTLITQEMLKKGFLASTNFYPSVAHDDNILIMYKESLFEVYDLIHRCQIGQANIEDQLEGPVCHSGFKRLN